MPSRTLYSILLLSTILPLAAARASDGVLEINQTCALTGGCVTGDAGGFPVTISEPGSYRLTSSLLVSVPSGGGDPRAIEIVGDNVTLDLGGFEVRCRLQSLPENPCSITPDGRPLIDSEYSRATIRNGFVQDAAGDGVITAGTVEDIVSRNNRRHGILVTPGSTVRRCAAVDNGMAGIVTIGTGSLVEANIIRGNVGHGIHASPGTGLRSNVLSSNGFDNAIVGGVDLGGNVCGYDPCS